MRRLGLLPKPRPCTACSLGGAAYTSQPFFIADEDRVGTNLLNPDQEGITVLGQAYLKAAYALGTSAKVFRQRIDTPFLNSYDVRMVPVTYEAYTLANSSIKGLDIMVSHVTGIKTLERHGVPAHEPGRRGLRQ